MRDLNFLVLLDSFYIYIGRVLYIFIPI